MITQTIEVFMITYLNILKIPLDSKFKILMITIINILLNVNILSMSECLSERMNDSICVNE